MKELKQNHINYLTLFNTMVVLGVIVFFLRKWREMLSREQERDRKIEQLQKSLKDATDHNKAVLGRINKKLTEISSSPQREKIQFVPPVVKEEIVREENEDLSNDLASLMA